HALTLRGIAAQTQLPLRAALIEFGQPLRRLRAELRFALRVTRRGRGAVAVETAALLDRVVQLRAALQRRLGRRVALQALGERRAFGGIAFGQQRAAQLAASARQFVIGFLLRVERLRQGLAEALATQRAHALERGLGAARALRERDRIALQRDVRVVPRQ